MRERKETNQKTHPCDKWGTWALWAQKRNSKKENYGQVEAFKCEMTWQNFDEQKMAS